VSEQTLTPEVKRILDFYPDANPAVKRNLAKILNTGALAGTGKAVILPVDQGVEHGPDRSFGPNPEGYDPTYHPQLAIAAGCNAYVAPLGQLEAAVEYTRLIPCILKVNGHTSMMPDLTNPWPAITASVADAVRLGCVGIGFTIYPGSKYEREMYQQLRELRTEAVDRGLVVVVWAYARGSGLPSKEAQTAVDVVAYAVHMACQLGAHIIKAKPPVNPVALEANKKVYEKHKIPVATLVERERCVVRAAFNGRRILIHSGGPKKESDQEVLKEIRQLKEGGCFGSIVGRNAFQRSYQEGIDLFRQIINIYKT
jgi:class I fructose-bisphosphate aldolase